MHNLDRDRNYFLGSDQRIYRVVGDSHDQFITAYVKYSLSPSGTKLFAGERYRSTPDVRDSFSILATEPGAIRHSSRFGSTVTGRDREKIVQWYDARTSLERVLNEPTTAARDALAQFVEELAKRGISSNTIGSTGSMQLDMDSHSSDIDLVCYGAETLEGLQEACAELLVPYAGIQAKEIIARRQSHMPSLPHEILVAQEQRKMQGLWKGRHLNIQPLRTVAYADPYVYSDVGAVSAIGVIADAEEGVFAPAYYRVEKTQILESEAKLPELPIDTVISTIGAYSQILKQGERFFAVGNLLRGEYGGHIKYVVSIDPWSRGFNNKLQLVI